MVSEGLPPPPGEFAAGSRVAGYRLEEQIGRGGMAVVFRALDERLERQVALKILAPALAADAAFRQRFIRESRAAAAVDDPHIIPVFEAGEASGVLFIAMRYVRGGDVRSLVGARGPLSPRRAAEMIAQVASALDAAHARGLVHRDVKPANMLLDSRADSGRPDHIYLSDFGLSKASLAPSGLTGTGQFLGTLDYVSPEQIEGRPVDGRADQYGLASAGFELLCGEPPFVRQVGMAVMYAKLSEPPPPLTARRPDLPPAVDAVFARALARDQDHRFATCREFAAALSAALGLRLFDSDSVGYAQPRPPTEVVQPGPPEPSQRPPAGQPPSEAPTSAADRVSADPPGWVAGEQTRQVASPPPARTGAGRDEQAPAAATRPSREPVSRTVGITGPGTGYPETGRSRSRSPVALVIAVLVLLALAGAGGGYYLLAGRSHGTSLAGHGGSGNGGGNHPGGGGTVALTAPGCGMAAAKAPSLTRVRTQYASLAANPFGIQASQNGQWVFATTPSGVVVLRKGPGLTLTPQPGASYAIAGGPKGMALTGYGHHLLVAAGNGITVLDVARAEHGDQSRVETGTLSTPGVPTGTGGAIQVALSRDGQFAFVVLQYRDEMSVFNLRQALHNRFTGSAFVGTVPLGTMPVGLAMSPDGNWLYAINSQASANSAGGSISVINAHTAATHPGPAAVVQSVAAGCQPARGVTSADGSVLWVTAKASSYLLGFSAAKLRTDTAHALIAKVQVGVTPIGLVLVDGGKRIIVADADTSPIPPAAHDLAVVDTGAALKAKPALLGYISSGQLPREFALVPGTQTLLVSDNGSDQIQAVNLADLP